MQDSNKHSNFVEDFMFIWLINYNKMRITFSILFTLFCLITFADQNEIVLNNNKQQHDHLEYYPPADQPDVYYDNVNQTIIIDGGGVVTCYDVEIAPVSTFVPVISTQVNGYYDTIDVSSLSATEYVITIYSPEDHTYEGFFEIE